MNASVSSAPFEHRNVFGIIHIAFLSFVGGGEEPPPPPTQQTESPASQSPATGHQFGFPNPSDSNRLGG
jgi:hypothetical protein